MNKGAVLAITVLAGCLVMMVLGAINSHNDLSVYHQAKLDAFVIVNRHNGLSALGLKQMEQLLDQGVNNK